MGDFEQGGDSAMLYILKTQLALCGEEVELTGNSGDKIRRLWKQFFWLLLYLTLGPSSCCVLLINKKKKKKMKGKHYL